MLAAAAVTTVVVKTLRVSSHSSIWSTIGPVLAGAAASLIGVRWTNRNAEKRAKTDRNAAEARANLDRGGAEQRARIDRQAAAKRATEDRAEAEKRAADDRREAEERARRDRAAQEQLYQADRADDHERERLREVRVIVDDAIRALRDMWEVLGIFVITDLRQRDPPPKIRPHLQHDRAPSKVEFLEVFDRLRDACVRLSARIRTDDTLFAPAWAAQIAADQAWNAIDQATFPLNDETKRLINYANAAASRGYQELRETARERFAPVGLEESRYQANLILGLRTRGAQAEALLGRLRGERIGRVIGPDGDGKIVVRDHEATAGEARARLEADLDRLDPGWNQLLELA